MQIFKVENKAHKTEDAHALCLELETHLGVNLSNKSQSNPNEVHGFLNTDSLGNIEVHLYEQPDLDLINSLPTNIRSLNVPRAVHNKNETALFNKLHQKLIIEKGGKLHAEMPAVGFHKKLINA